MMPQRRQQRSSSPVSAWGPSGTRGEREQRADGRVEKASTMQAWQSSVNPQELRDQLGGLRQPAASGAPVPGKKDLYQHVPSKLSGYLHGEELPPQPRHKRTPHRRERASENDSHQATRPGAPSPPPPSPGLASIPQSQLRSRILELRKELSMGRSALAGYLETHGRSAEFDSFSDEIDRLAKKLEQMEAHADANERLEQSTQRNPTPPTVETTAQSSPLTLSVDCPDGNKAGDTILVGTEWGEDLEVTVPKGVEPGQPFEFVVESPLARIETRSSSGTKVHEAAADRFENAIPPTNPYKDTPHPSPKPQLAPQPTLTPEELETTSKRVPESIPDQVGAAASATSEALFRPAVAPEQAKAPARSTASTSTMKIQIEQLTAELAQARLDIESERAHNATAVADMERRVASERELADERMLDAKVAARRQVESVQKATQELHTELECERKARRFAEKDAEQQRKMMVLHREKMGQIGLADCAAWSCMHEEVVRLIEMERAAAVMATEEATEEREIAEDECEKAELELRNAEREWDVREANFRQAVAKADARAKAEAQAAAEAREETQQVRQRAAEQIAAAEAAVRKLEKEQRNAVRARTAKSSQAWQEKQRAAGAGTGVGVTRNSHQPAPGSARESRRAKETDPAFSDRSSSTAAVDASGDTEGRSMSTLGSSPGRMRKSLPSFRVVQAAPVRSRPLHTSTKVGFLKAGTVITPLEKNRSHNGETWLRCECPASDDSTGVRKIQGWVALLDEKRMKKPMRDFTLLVGSSLFHGFRKCVVRASTSNELLEAVMAALESQGVRILPELLPLQVLHRDAEFKEALPVVDLDMLHSKARVRLEQQIPKDPTGHSVQMDKRDSASNQTVESPSPSASATTSAVQTADTNLPLSPAAAATVEAEINRLRRTLQDAEARAALVTDLQEQCDALSDSLAKESKEKARIMRSAQAAELQAHHFEARASTLQQVLTTMASTSADFPLDSEQ